MTSDSFPTLRALRGRCNPRSLPSSRTLAFAFAAFLICLAAPGASSIARAAAWPERPVTIVVPYAAGGAADVTARVIADNLRMLLGAPFLVMNRPGSVVATTSVARAEADGYTLMAAPMSHSMNTAMYKQLPYDTFNDFVPVATFGYFDYVVIARPTLGVKDLRGLIALLKANPGKYNFGSGGVGSPTHLVVELFKKITGTSAIHVPYRADQQAITDLMGGRIDFMISSTVAAGGHVNNGSVIGLAVPSPRRSARLPNVPTTAEIGLPEFAVSSYYVLIGPKGMSESIVDRLSQAVNQSLEDGAVVQRLNDLDFRIQPKSTPKSTQSLIREEAERWTPIIKEAGIALE